MAEMKSAGKLATAGAPKGNKNNPAKSKSQSCPTVNIDPKKTIADLGITEKQSSQMQRIAAVPEKKFDDIVESDTPSRGAVLKEAPKRTPKSSKPGEKKQPTARDIVRAKAHRERMAYSLGAVSGAVKVLTEYLDVTRVASACTPTELKEWVKDAKKSAAGLRKFAMKLAKEIPGTTDQIHEEEQRRDSEASPAA